MADAMEPDVVVAVFDVAGKPELRDCILAQLGSISRQMVVGGHTAPVVTTRHQGPWVSIKDARSFARSSGFAVTVGSSAFGRCCDLTSKWDESRRCVRGSTNYRYDAACVSLNIHSLLDFFDYGSGWSELKQLSPSGVVLPQFLEKWLKHLRSQVGRDPLDPTSNYFELPIQSWQGDS